MTSPAVPLRKTSQDLIPLQADPTPPGTYDLYPAHPLDDNKAGSGYEALAALLPRAGLVRLDGYGGVFWEELRAGLEGELRKSGCSVQWIATGDYLRPIWEIEALVAPFVGTDPVWGTRFTGKLEDFFRLAELRAHAGVAASGLTVVYGEGAALASNAGFLAYADVPKNEIQFRARAGSVANLGLKTPLEPKAAYKRCYFVDWVAMNAHKKSVLPSVDLWIDAQRPGLPAFCSGEGLRRGLDGLAASSFRVRPWFEPGIWGGQWCTGVVPQLPRNVPNYAWSFEMIVPENGIVFSSNGVWVECSFDCLMFRSASAVLGEEGAARFGDEFPIRFDFLDTMDGGNLSLQCHPRPAYIRKHFGETFTQDETYYMLETGKDAVVYLGFRDDIQPAGFRAALEHHQKTGEPIDAEKFVLKHPAAKHGLFLIPNGTVHCSGKNGVVLEISATPYIFTFKVYDWGRVDLDGKPRPINIQRAFDNFYFGRKGARVERELISHPRVLGESPGFRRVDLPTHRHHFYAIERLEFTGTCELATEGSVQVMSLVEGRRVALETADGTRREFNYAETFAVPAAAGKFRLVNLGGGEAKVVRSFLKPGWTEPPEGD